MITFTNMPSATIKTITLYESSGPNPRKCMLIDVETGETFEWLTSGEDDEDWDHWADV